jgi:hypothetical protein
MNGEFGLLSDDGKRNKGILCCSAAFLLHATGKRHTKSLLKKLFGQTMLKGKLADRKAPAMDDTRMIQRAPAA